VTTSARYNGRIPTDPTTLITALFTLYLLLAHLTPDQRDTLDSLTGIAALLLPHLPGRR
jgi:hypothetical protein